MRIIVELHANKLTITRWRWLIHVTRPSSQTSYRVVNWPFCYSSLLGHGNRLKYSNPQPHQATQRPKCTNSPPPWECKGKMHYPPLPWEGQRVKAPTKPHPCPMFSRVGGWGLSSDKCIIFTSLVKAKRNCFFVKVLLVRCTEFRVSIMKPTAQI